MSIDFDLLKRLCESHGVASREERVRGVALEALRPLVDEVRIDSLGNAVCLKRGKGARRVMLAAHLDEIGFLVRHVDRSGFLRVQPVGGFDARTLFAQRVFVHCANGDLLRGVFMPAAKPIHLLAGERPQPPRIDEFFVDLGMSGEQVQEKVEIGDMITLDRTTERVGENIVGKALDDRVGVFVMIEALRRMQNPEVDVVAVATVQEEVGLRGALTAAYGIEPDIGVAIDVTLAVDVPGMKEHEAVSKLGQGAGIKVMDSSLLCDPRLVRRFREIARRDQIPYQMEVMPRGGTDAGSIQRSRTGVPSITLSIPARYVHTVNEMVAERDVDACATLLARFLEEAHTLDLTSSE